MVVVVVMEVQHSLIMILQTQTNPFSSSARQRTPQIDTGVLCLNIPYVDLKTRAKTARGYVVSRLLVNKPLRCPPQEREVREPLSARGEQWLIIVFGEVWRNTCIKRRKLVFIALLTQGSS